jgi:hypothetical protein
MCICDKEFENTEMKSLVNYSLCNKVINKLTFKNLQDEMKYGRYMCVPIFVYQ